MADPAAEKNAGGIGRIAPRWRSDRAACRAAVRVYTAAHELVPPLTLEELEEHAGHILAASGISPEYGGFLMVLLNNEIWRPVFSATPFDRRLLLLPQCLRASDACRAENDEMGLLCAECGACPIGELQARAEQLGYLVLVAEGSTLVIRLLERGKVDAVVGVSCLAALEKSFPQTVANAIPSMAIPLYRDGCKDTRADTDWLREILELSMESPGRRRVDMDGLRRCITAFFDRGALQAILGEPATRTEEIALDWLAKAGKRWRPLLAAVAFEALTENPASDLACIQSLAVAVECFHKASLIHDDIEDEDTERYGDPALHRVYGIPLAINTGDLLIGEGYRLIAQSPFTESVRGRIMAIAAEAHRTLCIGQGEELAADFLAAPVTLNRIITIFRMKTSPAFAVALKFGAVAAGADEAVCRAIDAFSDALGIAYQIRDDISDVREMFRDGGAPPRLSLFSALAAESDENGGAMHAPPSPLLMQKAEMLLEHYRNEAVRSLSAFRNADLKSQLRRLLERLLESA